VYRKNDRQILRAVQDRIYDLIQKHGIINVSRAMKRDQGVALMQSVGAMMIRYRQEANQRVYHDVTDEMNPFCGNALALQVLITIRGRR
jgi:hypothetical protein